MQTWDTVLRAAAERLLADLPASLAAWQIERQLSGRLGDIVPPHDFERLLALAALGDEAPMRRGAEAQVREWLSRSQARSQLSESAPGSRDEPDSEPAQAPPQEASDPIMGQLGEHGDALLDEAAQAPDEWALMKLAEAARFRSAEFGGTIAPLPGMVSVFRVTHALAARVLAPKAAPFGEHWRFGPGRWLLWEYLRALHGFNAAVATAHAAGRLLVRDADTGLPVARLDTPSRAWAEQWERVAVFGRERDDRAAAALLLEPASDTYPEGLAVRLADAVAWVEAEGIAAPGELSALLDAWQARRERARRVCLRWTVRGVSGDALGPLVAKLYAAPTEDDTPKPVPGSDAEPETVPAPTVRRNSTKGRRRDALDPIIDRLLAEAADPTDRAAVWVALLALADRKDPPPPLLGVADGEVKYRGDDGEAAFIKRENFVRRLKRRTA